jgi:hypothetical protein
MADTGTPLTQAERERKRRGRNLAVMYMLLGVCALLFAITIVKMARF